MTLPLTQKQEQLWLYIRSCERSPSYVEMATALNLKSKSGVSRIICSLVKKGFVQRSPRIVRSVVALDPRDQIGVVMLQLRGRIS